MAEKYVIADGDTFESIARKVYGDDKESGRIERSNPGSSDALNAGSEIVVPSLPNAPRNVTQTAKSNNPNEVAVLIDGIRFRFWESVRITRSIDSIDAIELTAPFDSDIPDFRSMFKPLSYKQIDVTVGGNKLFTGTMIDIVPEVLPDKKIISVSGYSLPGVLNDCTAPASSYPVEFNDQYIKDIVTTLAASFGLGVQFDADQGAAFERVSLDTGKKILSFLIDLAKQRGLIISSTPDGDVFFPKEIEIGSPVAKLRQGDSPLLSVVPTFNPQDFYSHITGIEPVYIGLDGEQFTAKNERLNEVLRPFTFGVPDTNDADVPKAVNAKLGRMYGSAVSYSISVDTWRDSSGNLWSPNTTMMLVAPDAMIYNEYEFLIKSVDFERGRASEVASLNLVIPGTFTGKVPEVLPWDE